MTEKEETPTSATMVGAKLQEFTIRNVIAAVLLMFFAPIVFDALSEGYASRTEQERPRLHPHADARTHVPLPLSFPLRSRPETADEFVCSLVGAVEKDGSEGLPVIVDYMQVCQ